MHAGQMERGAGMENLLTLKCFLFQYKLAQISSASVNWMAMGLEWNFWINLNQNILWPNSMLLMLMYVLELEFP